MYNDPVYTRNLTEFQLIEQFLERWGNVLVDVRYYSEGFSFAAADPARYVGVVEGFKPKYTYFFGNVQLQAKVTGVVVLANKNYMSLNLSTDLTQRTEVTYLDVPMAIGSGINLLGDGEYLGSKRVYGAGFNRLIFDTVGWGAAVPTLKAHLNGYLFNLK